MVATTIIIQSLQDAREGKKIVEGVERSDFHECEKFSVAILEHGTEGGQTSIMFICRDGNKAVAGQMTSNQFEMLISAFRGALQRFGK